MELSFMGQVLVQAKIENLSDVYHAESGSIGRQQVRLVEVSEALIDTGAAALSAPRHLIEQLGLKHVRTRRARTATGISDVEVYSAVRLTVQGRDCVADVSELPGECPVLIGQAPLELLDFVVDSVGQRLTGNPDHGGEHMILIY